MSEKDVLDVDDARILEDSGGDCGDKGRGCKMQTCDVQWQRKRQASDKVAKTELLLEGAGRGSERRGHAG